MSDAPVITRPGAHQPGRRGRDRAREGLADAAAGARRREIARRRRRWRRIRALGCILGLALVYPVVSIALVLARPGTLSAPVRVVEWVRSHGGSPLVRVAESVWYRLNPPPVGGRPAQGVIPHLPGVTGTAVVRDRVPHLPPPAPIPQLAGVDVPGEGVWHPVGRTVHGLSAVYVTYLAPDPIHTSLVAGVAWMDPRLVRFRLFAGSQSPGTGSWPYHSPFSPTEAATLVAAFNAGFRIHASEGGWYEAGRTAVPLRTGAASFVIERNGGVEIGAWGSEVRMSPAVEAVRQNLSLIVDHGRPAPGLSNNDFAKWGATLGNQLLVWRSGVGITRDGAVVYVGGPGLSVTSLASLLVRAGAVRGMEMDINTDWVNYFFFDPPPGGLAAPANGHDLLPDMVRPPSRYFYPTARDFIAVFARSAPPVAAGRRQS